MMVEMQINHLAVAVAAISNLVLGGLWYSPALFHNAWKKENQLSDKELKKQNQAKVFGITLLLSFLMSYNMAFFLADEATDATWGITAGFLTGFGWAGAIFTVIGLFEMRTWRYILINSGFIIIYFTLIGFILGAWR